MLLDRPREDQRRSQAQARAFVSSWPASGALRLAYYRRRGIGYESSAPRVEGAERSPPFFTRVGSR